MLRIHYEIFRELSQGTVFDLDLPLDRFRRGEVLRAWSATEDGIGHLYVDLEVVEHPEDPEHERPTFEVVDGPVQSRAGDSIS